MSLTGRKAARMETRKSVLLRRAFGGENPTEMMHCPPKNSIVFLFRKTLTANPTSNNVSSPVRIEHCDSRASVPLVYVSREADHVATKGVEQSQHVGCTNPNLEPNH